MVLYNQMYILKYMMKCLLLKANTVPTSSVKM